LNYTNIAHEEIQDRRNQKIVEEIKTLHDYVPFYFAPRSPMLYCNHKQNIPNAKPQEEIIYFVANAEKIASHSLEFLFYDQHPVTATAKQYNNLDDLKKINWELFFEQPQIGGYCKYWQDNINEPRYVKRKAIRQAEFLIHQQISIDYIDLIAVQNKTTLKNVEEILRSYNIRNIKLEIKSEWYY
jgi:hypothetical protein